ncbi:MAG: ABC transporter permease [Clostridiales bacterium]|jgi:NitT/TauT family transport system permease protein|nr:ABC transporter permease [Clostridiales bacterium]
MERSRWKLSKKNNFENFSKEHIAFLKKIKKEEKFISIFQISLFLLFLFVWELAVRFCLIDSFVASSSYEVVKTFINLHKSNQLWNNIFITFFEVLVTFLLGSFLGVLISIFLWWFKVFEKVCRPYLIILNALPKIALGPMIIVWVGAGMKSIIVMSLLISVINVIINVTLGFKKVDRNKILLMKTFGASKMQILKNVVLPINIPNIMSTLKINIGMSLIGVITGEFLVSKGGIGYLIVYGGQTFKINLIITGIAALSLLALFFYFAINKIEKYVNNCIYKF